MVVYTPDQALNPEKKEQVLDFDLEIQMETKALTDVSTLHDVSTLYGRYDVSPLRYSQFF